MPQNYLTTEDYNYILDHYKSGKSDYVSYKLGRQYKIMLDATDEEETEYKDYEVSIQEISLYQIFIKRKSCGKRRNKDKTTV